jgi:hypothetical protein
MFNVTWEKKLLWSTTPMLIHAQRDLGEKAFMVHYSPVGSWSERLGRKSLYGPLLPCWFMIRETWEKKPLWPTTPWLVHGQRDLGEKAFMVHYSHVGSWSERLGRKSLYCPLLPVEWWSDRLGYLSLFSSLLPVESWS